MVRKKKKKKSLKPTQSTVSQIVIVHKLWPPDGKNWFTDAGKDWRREEKGTREDEMGWMALPTRWAWVWTGSKSWWWTGKSGVLQSVGSHDWATAQTLRRRIRILAPCFSAPTGGIYVQREESKIISSIKALGQWFLTRMILNPRGKFRDKNPGAGREQDCS